MLSSACAGAATPKTASPTIRNADFARPKKRDAAKSEWLA
jgi:hypothetical protein